MSTARLTSKGPLVIRPMVTDVRALKGILKVSGRQPVSVAAMDEAIRKRVRAKQR